MDPIKIYQQKSFTDDDPDRLDERINSWIRKMSKDPVNGFKIINVYPIDIGSKSGYTFLFYIFLYAVDDNKPLSNN